MDLLRAEMTRVGRTLDSSFHIYGRLPLFEHNAASREHAETAGSAGIGLLAGDYGKAIEYIAHAGEQGYTHLFVELPAATQIDELEPFRRNVIDKL
jgi:hypothetical protein